MSRRPRSRRGDTPPWPCQPVAAWRERPRGFWLGRSRQTQVRRSLLALALSPVGGIGGSYPGAPPAGGMGCGGAGVLCAHGGPCRAGRPKRLGFAGAQVPSSRRATWCPQGAQPHAAHRKARLARWPSSTGGSLSPGGEGPTQPAPSRTPSIPYATPTPMTSSKPCPPSRGRGSGSKGREDLFPRPRPPCSLPCSVGAHASLWPPWARRASPASSASCHPRSAALLPSTHPLLSLPSFLPLCFFFRRSLKPPSFITPWTGSRYCCALSAPLGACAQAGARPPGQAQIGALTRGSPRAKSWGEQACRDRWQDRGRTEPHTSMAVPWGQGPRSCPLGRGCTKPTVDGGGPEQGPRLRTLHAVHPAPAVVRPRTAGSQACRAASGGPRGEGPGRREQHRRPWPHPLLTSAPSASC